MTSCPGLPGTVLGLIPGLGRSPGGGHGNPLQYPCLENPMDRGAWRATVHGVSQTGTWLTWLSKYLCPSFILKDPVLQRTLVPGLSPESAACVGSPQPQRWLGLLGQEFSHLGGCPSRTPALLSCRTSVSTATVWKNYKRWSERGGSLSSHQLSVKWEGSASLLSHVSHVRLCATPWMVARQAPLSMGFSRQW